MQLGIHLLLILHLFEKIELPIKSKICYIQLLYSTHMVKNGMKKPKKTKNDWKNEKKILTIFQAVTHPSTDLARCCLTSSKKPTKWPPKTELKMAIATFWLYLHSFTLHFCNRTKKLVHTLVLSCKDNFSYSQKGIICAKYQKKP